jgi:hypothetical protein
MPQALLHTNNHAHAHMQTEQTWNKYVPNGVCVCARA